MSSKINLKVGDLIIYKEQSRVGLVVGFEKIETSYPNNCSLSYASIFSPHSGNTSLWPLLTLEMLISEKEIFHHPA